MKQRGKELDMRKIEKIDKPATPAELNFYNKLKERWEKEGHVSIGQMRFMFGYTTTAAVYKKLNPLICKGYIKRGWYNRTMEFLK